MAKQKSEPSEIQKRASVARDKYAAAKEAFEKHENATTKKALETATAERDAAIKAEKRERFERVGGPRVAKAINALQAIGKLAVPGSYEYGDNDVAMAEAALKTAFEGAMSALRAAKQKGGAKASAPSFSFGS